VNNKCDYWLFVLAGLISLAVVAVIGFKAMQLVFPD
jgi:hypothetical protein